MDDKTDLTTTQVERRHLTVLECDLVGSTALAHKLDPEKLGDLVLAYQDCVLSWIRKLDGYFVQFAGDAVWVYFGYPKAREDDAYRAIKAGLGMAGNVSSIQLHGELLNVRVGIASGLCVVGDLRQKFTGGSINTDSYITAIGDPPNLAARLQALVEPGAVAISNETHVMVGKLFEYEDMGMNKLKGFPKEIRSWRVLGESGERSRFRALRPSTHSPLIGRSNETETIARLWDAAQKKNGQIVYLSGDPGIGKSRLVTSVADDIVGNKYPQVWLHCSEHLRGSAFAPIIAHIRSQSGILDSDEIQFKSLENRYPELNSEAHYLLADLLSIENETGRRKMDMSAPRQRERLYEVLIELIENSCLDRPLLLVVEDMQWIDPSTRALLHRLTLRSSNLSLLILITSRIIDEADKSFLELFHVHNIHIEQLSRDESFILLGALWNGNVLAPAIAEHIVNQTDGVPLFIEDAILSLRQNVKENSADLLLDDIRIPTRLNDHLMSRIDSLGDGKYIAQIGAVVGREFSLAILQALTNLSLTVLKDRLTALVSSGLILEIEQGDEQKYVFKHAMIRDAAYASLLQAHRKELHGQIANWLATESPLLRQSQPEMIAIHYNDADAFEQAINYWLAAGKRYNSRCNYVEASIHLENAHRQIHNLADSAESSRIELDIITALGVAYAGAGGFSSEHTGRIYDKARLLCKILNYPNEIFPILSGAGSFHLIRSNYEKASEIAAQTLQLATEKSNATGIVTGNRILGAVYFLTGNFELSIKSLQSAITTYDEDPTFHQSYALAYALDLKTSSLCYLSLANLTIGKIDLAYNYSQESLVHANDINMHSVNYALVYQAALSYLRGDPPELVVEVATRSLNLALEEGYVSFAGISRVLMGEAIIRAGGGKEGLREIEQGVSEYGTLMAQSFLPFAQSVLAKGYFGTKYFDRALGLLTKAEALTLHTRQYWYLPEIQRLHAEALVQLDDYKVAANYYNQAIESAQKIGAKFWLKKIIASRSENLDL